MPKCESWAKAHSHKLYSHHEAGHCVIRFLFGQGHKIDCISMARNDKLLAHTFIWGSPHRELICKSDKFLVKEGILGTDLPAWLKSHGRLEILSELFGPAAQDRIGPRSDWLGSLHAKNEHVLPTRKGSDIQNAYRLAVCMKGTERRAWNLIGKISRWADDLLDAPRVWRIVSGLAGELIPDGLLEGREACRIMREIWGDHCDPPIKSLGRKWLRRFSAQSKGS